MAKHKGPPTIIGAKGNVAKEAAKTFVELKENIELQKMVVFSQCRLIAELVKTCGTQVDGKSEFVLRLNKSKLQDLEESWDLTTTDDLATNEMVLVVRKSVDINRNEENSPKNI